MAGTVAQDRDQAAAPRPAAAVVLVRDGAGEPEVLIVRRNPDARFMGGVWVFPGGSLQGADYEAAGCSRSEGQLPLPAARIAARRELSEEAGIELPSSCELAPFTRWITPVGLPIRFDTLFFLARLPAQATPRVDGAECVAARFISPSGALAGATAGELALAFPTIKQLQSLAAFHSCEEIFAAASGFDLAPICPRIASTEQGARLLMPGDQGY
jgi:8-oxo-dGTP pyrophosphatase MutT (NUDIX family)